MLAIIANLTEDVQAKEGKDERIRRLEAEVSKLHERCDEMHVHTESIRAELISEKQNELEKQRETRKF